MYSPEVIAAIQAHAIACYPNEMCGAVTPTGFQPLQNRSADPKHQFDCATDAAALQVSGQLLALVHSHPDGPEYPSGLDIGSQRAMDIPWGLLTCTASWASVPFWWGDMLDPPPLIGRPFRHGPSGSDGRGDCGALIRDYYRLERNTLIPDFPRDNAWWLVPGQDLYNAHFTEAGFVPVSSDDPQPGDVVLIQWRVPPDNRVPNHGAVYTGGGLLLHHLEGRLSRPEPVLHWKKFVRSWLRHAAG